MLKNKLCSVLSEREHVRSNWSFTMLADAMSSLNSQDAVCNVQINKLLV